MTELTIFTVRMRLETYGFVGSGLESYPDSKRLKVMLMTADMKDTTILEQIASTLNLVPTKYPVQYSGSYFIPGSTLRGLSRSRYELYSSPRVCYIVSDKLDIEARTHQQLFDIDEKIDPKNRCHICKIYGSLKVGKSKVDFSDAKMTKGVVPEYFIGKGHGTEILYVFPPGSEFTFTIRVRGQNREVQANILQSFGILEKEGRIYGISKYWQKIREDGNIFDFGVAYFELLKIEDYRRGKIGQLEKIKLRLEDSDLSEQEKDVINHAIKEDDYSKISKKEIYKKVRIAHQKKLRKELKEALKKENFISIDEAAKMEFLRKSPSN